MGALRVLEVSGVGFALSGQLPDLTALHDLGLELRPDEPAGRGLLLRHRRATVMARALVERLSMPTLMLVQRVGPSFLGAGPMCAAATFLGTHGRMSPLIEQCMPSRLHMQSGATSTSGVVEAIGL